MYYFYVLQGVTKSAFHTGHTDNLGRCIQEHNAGLSFYTLNKASHELFYVKEFTILSEI